MRDTDQERAMRRHEEQGPGDGQALTEARMRRALAYLWPLVQGGHWGRIVIDLEPRKDGPSTTITAGPTERF